MKSQSINTKIKLLMAGVVVSLAFSAQCIAQSNNPPQGNNAPETKGNQQEPKAAPKVDPKEEAAYKEFYEASPQDPDQKIELGKDFLQKYPMSQYVESVD